MAEVEWSALAEQDLLEILSYIADENPDAAKRFNDRIQIRVTALATQPRQYRTGRVAGTREMVVHPCYVVVYTEMDAKVLILRVLHTALQWPVGS